MEIPGTNPNAVLYIKDMLRTERRSVKYVSVGPFTGNTKTAYLSLPLGSELVNVGVINDHVEKCKKRSPSIVFHGIEGNSILVSRRFADRSLDYVFIEAVSYEEVNNEIRAWWPKVKLGGYLIGMQWQKPEVAFAVHNHFDSFYQHPDDVMWTKHRDLAPTEMVKFKVENADTLKKMGCGILTTVDAKFFSGFQMLVYSTRGMMPLAVVDLGMTYPQRDWCHKYNVELLAPPEDVYSLGPDWKYYCKPLLIRDSVFQNTLWLDSDCILVGNPTAMFETIIEKPFVVEHWHAWMGYHPNTDMAYQHFPTKRFSISCNCGVLGFNPQRDADFMKTWIDIVKCVSDKPELRSHITFWDEGCFHIAAQKLDMPEIVEKKRGWNQPLFLKMSHTTASFEEFLKQLPVPDFDDVVYHNSGSPKCWESWK